MGKLILRFDCKGSYTSYEYSGRLDFLVPRLCKRKQTSLDSFKLALALDDLYTCISFRLCSIKPCVISVFIKSLSDIDIVLQLFTQYGIVKQC